MCSTRYKRFQTNQFKDCHRSPPISQMDFRNGGEENALEDFFRSQIENAKRFTFFVDFHTCLHR